VLFNQVPASSLFGGAIIGELAVELAKSLMVLGGHHHVSHTCLLGQLGPCAGGIWFWIKALRERRIFGHRDPFVLHDPLVTAQHAIEAPMDEHAEFGLMPPFHAAGTICFISGLWRF